eukprot:gene4092-5840_t
MSWSENRTKEAGWTKVEIKDKIDQINKVLSMLAHDEDLHDDFQLPEVQKALDHWTGVNRLPPDQAMQFMDHRRCVYVLQKLQIFQQVCKQAGLPVPLELMLKRKSELSNELIKKLFPGYLDDNNNNRKNNDDIKLMKDDKIEIKEKMEKKLSTISKLNSDTPNDIKSENSGTKFENTIEMEAATNTNNINLKDWFRKLMIFLMYYLIMMYIAISLGAALNIIQIPAHLMKWFPLISLINAVDDPLDATKNDIYQNNDNNDL